MKCLMKAWEENEPSLRGWLLKKTEDHELTNDLLQDVFIKALKHKDRFCTLDDGKTWLFTIARNTTIDLYRKPVREVNEPSTQPLSPLESEPDSTLLKLQTCMARVLSELDDQDREAIELCDIHGMPQHDFASEKGLSLPAAKSRIQRARVRLRSGMISKCKIQFDDTGVCDFTPRK